MWQINLIEKIASTNNDEVGEVSFEVINLTEFSKKKHYNYTKFQKF